MQSDTHPIIGKEEIRAVFEVLTSDEPLSGFKGTPEGHLGGKKVRELEDLFCQYFNVKYAVSMNSATSALHTALLATDLPWGSEVIVSPFTFSSSASCVLMANMIPVFADIDPKTFCISPESIRKVITSRTRAIIPVHLCGHPADMEEILKIAEEYNLFVIEDAAQSIGAKFQEQLAGTMGDCGIFSFNQSKHISTGEGGMLITNYQEIAESARAVRNHGEVSVGGKVGWNYRMTELEAALAIPQFKKLDQMNAIRQELCDELSSQLCGMDGITPPHVRGDCTHVYYTYAMKYHEECMPCSREEFQSAMMNRGIYFGSGYVKPLYLLPVYQKRMHPIYSMYGSTVSYSQGICQVAERMWSKEIMVTDRLRYPLTLKEVEQIPAVIREVLYACEKNHS